MKIKASNNNFKQKIWKFILISCYSKKLYVLIPAIFMVALFMVFMLCGGLSMWS